MASADPSNPSTSFDLPAADAQDARQLIWRSAGITDIGYVRSINEDAHLDARENNLWVVADGMGGHSFGDKASQIIIEQLVDFKPGDTVANDVQNLERRILQANTQCRNLADGGVMGSTVAALYARDPYCFFLWAGDSRIYRYRDNQLEQVTEDHSLVQELVSLGELRREDMERHPSSHIITRAVGVHAQLQLEMHYALVEPGDRYLICSDGLYKDLTAEEIASGMAAVSIQSAVKGLVKHALERGGSDNTTAIVVQAEQHSPA